MIEKLQKGVDSTDSLTVRRKQMSKQDEELWKKFKNWAKDEVWDYEPVTHLRIAFKAGHSSRDDQVLELTSRVAVTEGANVELEAENKKLREGKERFREIILGELGQKGITKYFQALHADDKENV